LRIKIDIQKKGKASEEFKKRLEYLQSSNEPLLKIGLLGDPEKNSRDGEIQTNVEIGISHELGLGVPKRSFIKAPFLRKQKEYGEKLKKILASYLLRDADLLQQLNRLGASIAADMKKYVAAGTNLLPNSPRTIAEKRAKGRWNKNPKGEPKPLIDTGRMIGALTWKARS
jgi:hypothetical protein